MSWYKSGKEKAADVAAFEEMLNTLEILVNSGSAFQGPFDHTVKSMVGKILETFKLDDEVQEVPLGVLEFFQTIRPTKWSHYFILMFYANTPLNNALNFFR